MKTASSMLVLALAVVTCVFVSNQSSFAAPKVVKTLPKPNQPHAIPHSSSAVKTYALHLVKLKQGHPSNGNLSHSLAVTLEVDGILLGNDKFGQVIIAVPKGNEQKLKQSTLVLKVSQTPSSGWYSLRRLVLGYAPNNKPTVAELSQMKLSLIEDYKRGSFFITEPTNHGLIDATLIRNLQRNSKIIYATPAMKVQVVSSQLQSNSQPNAIKTIPKPNQPHAIPHSSKVHVHMFDINNIGPDRPNSPKVLHINRADQIEIYVTMKGTGMKSVLPVSTTDECHVLDTRTADGNPGDVLRQISNARGWRISKDKVRIYAWQSLRVGKAEIELGSISGKKMVLTVFVN